VADKIKGAVFRMHTLTSQATHLLRLWLIDDPSSRRCEAVLEDETYRFALEVVSAEGASNMTQKDTAADAGDAMKLRADLTKFYRTDFETLLVEGAAKTSRSKLTQMFCLEGQRLAAGARINIKEHFTDHLGRFINAFHDVRRTAPPTSQKEARSAHFAKFRTVKNDILDGQDASINTEDPELRAFVKEWREHLPSGPYAEDSVAYDVCVRPNAYMPAMIAMSGAMRSMGRRAFQVLPLRLSNTPVYVTIDTKALMEITRIPRRGKRFTYGRKLEIWSTFLKIETSCDAHRVLKAPGITSIDDSLTRLGRTFRRGAQLKPTYVFRGSISTDGHGVSIGLVRTDLHDLKGMDGPWLEAAKKEKASKATPIPNVEDLPEGVEAALAGREYVVVDPGKRDLHYGLDIDGKHLRYTQATRKAAMKVKRYVAIRDMLHTQAGKMGAVDQGKSVKEWEGVLSQHDSRAVVPDVFKKWIRAKMESVEATHVHWQNESFRKLKVNAKANARRSEDTYLNRFTDAFGDATERVVVVGDWSQGVGHLKRSPPTMRRGLVAALRRRKYEVWLIREFRTSKSCNICHKGDCAPHKFEGKARHGLLRCKNVDCEQFHNRNANATRNMIRIVEAARDGTSRPADMARAA
jgi:hypothetical protein